MEENLSTQKVMEMFSDTSIGTIILLVIKPDAMNTALSIICMALRGGLVEHPELSRFNFARVLDNSVSGVLPTVQEDWQYSIRLRITADPKCNGNLAQLATIGPSLEKLEILKK